MQGIQEALLTLVVDEFLETPFLFPLGHRELVSSAPRLSLGGRDVPRDDTDSGRLLRMKKPSFIAD